MTVLAALTAAPTTRIRRRLRVSGLVQGVGFRPFVYVLATELALAGAVSNDSNGVVVEVEGPRADVETFAVRLRTHAPPLALIDRIDS